MARSYPYGYILDGSIRSIECRDGPVYVTGRGVNSRRKFRLNSLRNRRLLKTQYLRPLRRAGSILREFVFQTLRVRDRRTDNACWYFLFSNGLWNRHSRTGTRG